MELENRPNVETIVGVYKMIVYESGKVELIKQPMDYIFDSLDMPDPIFHPSGRIKQIILVLEHVSNTVFQKKLLPVLTVDLLSNLISKACNAVAEENEIAVQTVMDKLTRQMGLNKEGFTGLLLDFFSAILLDDFEKSALKQELFKFAGKSRKNDDISYIEYSLRHIADMFYTMDQGGNENE